MILHTEGTVLVSELVIEINIIRNHFMCVSQVFILLSLRWIFCFCTAPFFWGNSIGFLIYQIIFIHRGSKSKKANFPQENNLRLGEVNWPNQKHTFNHKLSQILYSFESISPILDYKEVSFFGRYNSFILIKGIFRHSYWK